MEFIYFVSLIIVLIIYKWLYMWYAEIPKRNRYMETQIKLLSQIAAASGVDTDKIAEIVAKANLPKTK